jgi:pimeloyl-ACP methyl ester carboxylesterase
VTKALDDAAARKANGDDKLVVVAHSMGGNIVYDILTHYRSDLVVDLLVTVGSQVAFFKEMGLYHEDAGQRPGPNPARVSKPAAVRAWLNVFDPMDVLAFAAGKVFEGVSDFAFSNQASPLDAHSLYFFRPGFHERLRARIEAVDFEAQV